MARDIACVVCRRAWRGGLRHSHLKRPPQLGTFVHYFSVMTETDAQRFRKDAQECREQAEKAVSQIDKASVYGRLDQARASCRGKAQNLRPRGPRIKYFEK